MGAGIPREEMTRRNRLASLPLQIFDCDNVLSDDGWRIKFIDWSQEDRFLRYDKYHQLCIYDRPGRVDLLPPERDAATVIFTAMPEFYRETREYWLESVGIKADLLLMRKTGDFRPSAKVKRDMLVELCFLASRNVKDVVCAYDDHAAVVDMYKEVGINATRIAIHDVCAYTNNLTGAKEE